MPQVQFFHSPDADGKPKLRAVVTGALDKTDLEVVRQFCREDGSCVLALPDDYTVKAN